MPDPRESRRYCFRLIREVTAQHGWKYKLWIPAAVVLSSVFLLPPRLMQYFTEGTQKLSEIDGATFLHMLAIFGVAIAACLWLAIFLTGILSEWLRLTISIGLKNDAVQGLGQTRIDALDTALRGDWMTRLSGDLFTVEEFLTESIPDQVRDFTMLVGAAVLFFVNSGPIAFLPLVGAALLAWVNIVVQRKIAPTLGEVREIEGGVFQAMIETFEGLRTIRSYGGERFTHERIRAQLQDLFAAGMRIVKKLAALMGVNEMVGQVTITIVLTLVAYRVQGDNLTASEALFYPFYLSLFLNAAKGLVNASYNWNRFFIEGGRLATLLYDDSKKEQERSELFGDFGEPEAKEVRRMASRDIVISYGDAPPVIEGFDFELRTGEIVAIMGPSGCGKSTFVESFAGLRRVDAGAFDVETSDGKVRTFDHAPNFLSAFVEQQPYLFVGTIRDNVAFGMADVSDDDVWGALREVDLEEMVRDRGGLDSVLADRGRNLSVGQQYRLALCRALVCGRPFLFLDEPFAALDVESVDRVAETLKEEKRNGAGIILITHLLPPSLAADRVVEMEPALREELPPPGFGGPMEPGHGAAPRP